MMMNCGIFWQAVHPIHKLNKSQLMRTTFSFLEYDGSSNLKNRPEKVNIFLRDEILP